MNQEQPWPNSLCSGGSSRDCWGAASHTASPTARATPGRLDSPASRRGHEYSQTCTYKEGIKICTAASFQCVWKLPKVTNLKCAKNSFVKKSGKKKKAFLGNSASETHLKYQDTFARHLPRTDGGRSWACAPRAQQFFMASLRFKRMPVSHSVYIYKYMYLCL